MLEKLNYKHNRNIYIESEPINGQGVGAISMCRYGLFPMSYNGCEIISVYNLCLLIGRERPLPDIAEEIYPYGSMLCGLFGTYSYALNRYFKDNDMPVYMLCDYYYFKKKFVKYKYGILSFWNDKKIYKGIHTVTVENTCDGLKVYNPSNKSTKPAIYKGLDEYICGKKFICGYYFDPLSKKD